MYIRIYLMLTSMSGTHDASNCYSARDLIILIISYKLAIATHIT